MLTCSYPELITACHALRQRLSLVIHLIAYFLLACARQKPMHGFMNFNLYRPERSVCASGRRLSFISKWAWTICEVIFSNWNFIFFFCELCFCFFTNLFLLLLFILFLHEHYFQSVGKLPSCSQYFLLVPTPLVDVFFDWANCFIMSGPVGTFQRALLSWHPYSNPRPPPFLL